MEIRDEDEHEHARTVLIVLRDGRQAGDTGLSFTNFVSQMREEYPEMGLIRLQNLYAAYVGWDGRERPFLSIETGKRL
jgi:hypothetical protein